MAIEFKDPLDMNQLEVQNLQLQNLGSDPATPVEGQIWHRSDLHRPKVNDGTINQELAFVSDIANKLDKNTPITGGQFTKVTVDVDGLVTAGTSATKADIGLGNVDNTSDVNKPVSTAQQTALNLKANLASPTFTGTVSGITKTMVGLGNVDNTSDVNKPISTAQQTALNGKQNLDANLTSIAALSDAGTGLVRFTSGTAALDTNIYLTASQFSTSTTIAASEVKNYRIARITVPSTAYHYAVIPFSVTAPFAGQDEAILELQWYRTGSGNGQLLVQGMATEALMNSSFVYCVESSTNVIDIYVEALHTKATGTWYYSWGQTTRTNTTSIAYTGGAWASGYAPGTSAQNGIRQESNVTTVGALVANSITENGVPLSNKYLNASYGGTLDVNNFSGLGNKFYIGGDVGAGSWANRPGGDNSAALLTMRTHPTDYYSQLYLDTRDDRVWYRTRHGGTTRAWNYLIKSDDTRLTDARTPTAHSNATASVVGIATAGLFGHARASGATPLVAGTAALGTDNGYFAREAHVHPAQTTITGNAGTATKLAAAVGINGVAFDGSGPITITAVPVDSGFYVQGNNATRSDSSTNLDTIVTSGFATAQPGATGLPVPGFHHLITTKYQGNLGNNWTFQMAAGFGVTATDAPPEGYYVRIQEGTTWKSWRKLYHDGEAIISTFDATIKSITFGDHPTLTLTASSPGPYFYTVNINGGIRPITTAREFLGDSTHTWKRADIDTLYTERCELINYTANTNYAAFYGVDVTPNNYNFGALIHRSGTVNYLNGTTSAILSHGGSGTALVNRVVADATGVKLYGGPASTQSLGIEVSNSSTAIYSGANLLASFGGNTIAFFGGIGAARQTFASLMTNQAVGTITTTIPDWSSTTFSQATARNITRSLGDRIAKIEAALRAYSLI